VLTITLTIDLEPGGRRDLRRRISRHVVFVANDGSGNEELGNYLVAVQDPRRGAPIIGRLRGHRRSRGAFPLVARALAVVVRHEESQRAA